MESNEKLRGKMKKNLRKQNRCKNILKNHEGLETVDFPTKYLFVGNGGLICGVQREILMEAFNPYGSVQDIIMVPDKPYAFIIYGDEKHSEVAMEHLHGQKLNPDFDSVLYLCYVKDLPRKVLTKNMLPPGLIIIKDFITEEEENMLLGSISFDSENNAMKHRRVKHYGYEFNYSTNNVDRNMPLEDKIPDMCYQHLEKLIALGHITQLPDQLTVNHYLPGQGIPPHIDTHSAFEDELISLSLGSQWYRRLHRCRDSKGSNCDRIAVAARGEFYGVAMSNYSPKACWVIMDFYHPNKEHIPVLLPRRSVIIMTGESRYLWRHGITPRKTDVIPLFNKDECHLTLSYRQTRTSFTFRRVRQSPCNCEFIQQCDSQMPKLEFGCGISEKDARDLENKYVTEVYENIADHFSETRFKPWPLVAKFINALPLGTVLVDAGCGNGKNMGGSTNCLMIGCDISMNLAKVCAERKLQVVVGDMLSLPFRDNCADVCVCIAVIHHMATRNRRLAAINEILRILKPGGQSLIYVWALEQETSDGPSNYLNHNKIARKQETSPDVCDSLKLAETKEDIAVEKALPIHDNRTHFKQQDILVPWHKKTNNLEESHGDVYQRFYHVFRKGELEELVLETNAQIINSYYDKGNWCVIIEKCVNMD